MICFSSEYDYNLFVFLHHNWIMLLLFVWENTNIRAQNIIFFCQLFYMCVGCVCMGCWVVGWKRMHPNLSCDKSWRWIIIQTGILSMFTNTPWSSQHGVLQKLHGTDCSTHQFCFVFRDRLLTVKLLVYVCYAAL